MAARELLRLRARLTALQVDDLPVANPHHHVAHSGLTFIAAPEGRGDYRVLAHACELGVGDPANTSPSNPGLEDRTGLAGSTSRRRVFPPEVAARHPAPLSVLREHRGEQAGVTLVQCLCCLAQALNHAGSDHNVKATASGGARQAHVIRRRAARGDGCGPGPALTLTYPTVGG